MTDLESDLAGATPTDSSSTDPAALASTTANDSKNSALNPAHAKSFVVHASTTGEVPPTPPAPPVPPLLKTERPAKQSATLPAPKVSNAQPAADATHQDQSLTSEDEFLPLKPNHVANQKSSSDSHEVKVEAVAQPADNTAPQSSPAKTEQTGASAVRPKAGSQNSDQAATPKSNAATHMHIGDQPAKSTATQSTNTRTTNTASSNTASTNTANHASIVTPSTSSKINKADKLAVLGQQTLESIEFNDVPLADAMKLFSEQAGLNVITSAEAGKSRVTVFLKQVTALNALEAIVKANGLFYRVEEASGIVRIATSKEYEKDLSSFREEQTRVFTLLYPNPIAVAQVIQQVFGDRVQIESRGRRH